MPHHTMLYHAIPCHATLCYFLYYAMVCYVMLSNTLLHYLSLYYITIPYYLSFILFLLQDMIIQWTFGRMVSCSSSYTRNRAHSGLMTLRKLNCSQQLHPTKKEQRHSLIRPPLLPGEHSTNDRRAVLITSCISCF